MTRQSTKPPDFPWILNVATSLFSYVVGFLLHCNLLHHRTLLNLFNPRSSTSTDPVNSTDFVVDSSRGLWLRRYAPTFLHSSAPHLIFFHGGGFFSLSADFTYYDKMCQQWAAQLPAVILSVNYRLSPEHKCPSQYEDAFDALTYVDAEMSSVLLSSADLKRCYLAGDSAGANIAHHVAIRSSNFKFKALNIIGMISVQPFFGGVERTTSEIRLAKAPILFLEFTDWMWKMFLPDGSDRDHPASNVFGPNSCIDLTRTDFPSTLIIVGGYDLLQDRQIAYYEKLMQLNIGSELKFYPNAVHAFYLFSNLPEFSLLIQDVRSFMQRHS